VVLAERVKKLLHATSSSIRAPFRLGVPAELSQLLSHPAVFLCELAVARRPFPVLLAMTAAAFGRIFESDCDSLLTVCGSG
jgi:hypothetical protein